MNIQGAVITADIVNSTSMGIEAVASLRTSLEKLVYANQGRFLSFYRGDSFQCYLSETYPAYKLALILRTQARLFEKEGGNLSTDLKVSIGIGGIETPVNQLKTAQGQAFVLSGRGLDTLEKTGNRLIIQSEDDKSNLTFETISLFTDYLFQALTNKQAEVLQHLLQGRTQLEISKQLNKTQSTINRHAQSLGWKQFEELLRLNSEVTTQINNTHG